MKMTARLAAVAATILACQANVQAGETFYFTELAAAIHNALKAEIDSVVLVPSSSTHEFGDLFQVLAREDEIIQADIGVEDIEIIQSFTATNLRQDF